jgi:hypothetical protein
VVKRETVRRTIAQHIRRVTDKSDLWSVWSDFVEMAAIAISNGVDVWQRVSREERYMAIARRYDSPTLQRIAEAFGALTLELEEGIDDILGRTFMELELGSKWAGQFFTPFPVCRMMAEMTLVDIKPMLNERPFITASDPAVGGGAMPLALCAAMKDAGIAYQDRLHVTVQDIDERAAHMAYVQLSLVGVPGIVIVGDTLRMEERARWYTPAHVFGGWTMRLAHDSRDRGGQPTEHQRAQQPQPEQPQPSTAQLALF